MSAHLSVDQPTPLHLLRNFAGWLGVQIADRLEERGFLQTAGLKTYTLTPLGRVWFQSLRIRVPSMDSTPESASRRCLDWTERRHHLAGGLGCSMFKRFQELGRIVTIRDTRAICVRLEGKRRSWDLLRIPIG